MKRYLFIILLFPLVASPQSEVIFSDDFSRYTDGASGAPNWNVVKGQWQVIDGKFQQLSDGYDCATLLPYFLDGAFEISARMRVLGKYNGAGFVFHSESRESIANAQMIRFDDNATMLLGFFREGNYNATHLVNFPPVAPNSWNTLRLAVNTLKNEYGLFWNEHPLREHVPLDCIAGYIGLQASGGPVEFDDVLLRRITTAEFAEPFAWPRQFALDASGNFVVPDRNRGVVRVVNRSGKILQEFGKSTHENGQLGAPVAVGVDSGNWLVADAERNLLHEFSSGGQWRHAISAAPLGETANKFEPLSSPVALAVDRNGWLFVAEKEKHRVRIYDRQRRTQFLLTEPRLQSPVAIAIRDSFIAVGAEGKVFIYISQNNSAAPQLLRVLNLPWGMVNGLAWHGQKLFASIGQRVLRLALDGKIERNFTIPSPGGWRPWGLAVTSSGEVMIADFEMARIIVTDTALIKPLLSIPPRSCSNRPAVSMPPAPKNKMPVWEMRAAAIILANVWDSTKTSLPPLLPQTEITRIKNQIEDARQFYWMNSGMRFHLVVDYVVVPQRLTRAQVFNAEDYYPPREGNVENFLRETGKNIRDYQSVFYVVCIQDSIKENPPWALRGKGGAFTIGVGAGKGYGYSWWEATRNGHHAGNNWLAVHEFHHQLDDVFAASGYAEYWFNHFSVSVGTADDFGEHFDGNAYILKNWPPPQWFAPLPRWGSLQFARDADHDGIPDNAPRLPMDEKRLNSNPRTADSDDDGVSDFAELLRANWIVEGWGETYARSRFPSLNKADSDGDGVNDGSDEAPLYPWPTRITKQPESIGALAEPRVKYFAWWETDSLYLAFESERWLDIKILLDAQADGWFVGRDNIELRYDAVAQNFSLRFFDAGKVNEWPQMRSELAQQIKYRATWRQSRLEVAITKNSLFGLEFRAGQTMALNFAFRAPASNSAPVRYQTPHEPNRLVKFVLQD
jgi:hypothetical protein